MYRLLTVLLLSGSALFSATSFAEQRVDQGPWRVHYAALASRDLAPAVARQFGVSRSSKRGLLVLNAQRVDGDQTVPVAASGSGSVRSLIGHQQKLNLRPAQEGPVHYLLAEFDYVDQEHLNFELQVQPAGAPAPLTVRFKQQFYAD